MVQKIAGFLLSAILLAGGPGQAYAQMFSVGDARSQFMVPRTEVYFGLEPMDVNYKGDSENLGAGAFQFEGSILRLGYDTGDFDFFLGTGGDITGIEDVSYFDIGGNIDFGLNLYRSKGLQLQLPFRISSRFTNMTNDQTTFFRQNRFRFGSLTAGAGARIAARPKENFRIEAGAIPSYGFAFASGGFFGGSLGSVAARGRVYFDRLFGDIGLALGYKYDLRNYDIDDDAFDYKIKGHTIEIGITF